MIKIRKNQTCQKYYTQKLENPCFVWIKCCSSFDKLCDTLPNCQPFDFFCKEDCYFLALFDDGKNQTMAAQPYLPSFEKGFFRDLAPIPSPIPTHSSGSLPPRLWKMGGYLLEMTNTKTLGLGTPDLEGHHSQSGCQYCGLPQVCPVQLCLRSSRSRFLVSARPFDQEPVQSSKVRGINDSIFMIALPP